MLSPPRLASPVEGGVLVRPKTNSRGSSGVVRQRIIKITTSGVAVRNQPLRMATVVCRLQKDFIVTVVEELLFEDVLWFRLNSGWMCSKDSNGVICFTASNEMEANKFWAFEFDTRRRVSSAICQMLTKSCSLPNARKIAAILYNRAAQSNRVREPALNIPHVTTEDLLIGIASAAGKGLVSNEIFEFMKAAASKQSDPVKALVGIAEDLFTLMNLRPTLWVKRDLGILDTETLMIKNNQFVMAAARNDYAKVQELLDLGQELTALHSEMKYTALHAAADFGAGDALKLILKTGIPPNIRDARFGQTALHFAAQSGRAAMITILLEHGADRTIPDIKGVLPYEVANELGYAQCREMLKEPPPPIMLASVVGCSSASISIVWESPAIIRAQHALIEEYMVVHQDVSISSPKFDPNSDDNPNADHKWNASRGFQPVEGIDMLFTTDTKIKISGLTPSTGHSFLLLSRSAAGWSKPSAKLLHFTLPDVPSEPSKVELLKVNKNGLVISWYPPYQDNGCKIILYQIEMTDREPVIEVLSDGDDDELVSIEGSEAGMESLGGTSIASNSVMSKSVGMQNVLDNDGGWHRLIKHRQVDLCEKYLMGLESGKKYYFRCQCKNEVGWSPWGAWSGPYVPREGVSVAEFGDMWIRLQWVTPFLLKRRTVTAYKVQMCEPTGPRQNSLSVFNKNRKESKALDSLTGPGGEDSAGGYEFFTIDDNVKDSTLVIRNLKPGLRYQFRVLPQIDEAWCEANLMQISDIISIPASSPEAPTNIRVGSVAPTLYRRPTTGAAVSTGQLESSSEVADNLAVSVYYNEDNKQPAVAHDSILLTWCNGNPNGSPIIATAIEMARVREYNHEDTVLSLNSSGRLRQYISISDGNTAVITAEKNYAASIEADLNIEAALEWKDVTSQGKYVTSTSFRVSDLLPNCGYIFRVRQCNGIGWSEWSKSSEMAITLTAAPPSAPIALHLGSYYAVIEWGSLDGEFSYSILDYELQVALLPAGKNTSASSASDHDDSTWDLQLEWSIPESRPYNKMDTLEEINISQNMGHKETVSPKSTKVLSEAEETAPLIDNFNCRCVFVDKLSPMSMYVSRVKIRTVTGWTAWSGIGKPFRTLSPP